MPRRVAEGQQVDAIGSVVRLVLCADQAANYSEMTVLLRALVARGHECNFIFPTNDKREAANAREIAQLREWQETGLLSTLTLFDLDAIAQQSRPIPRQPKAAPRPGPRRAQRVSVASAKPAVFSYRQRFSFIMPFLPEPVLSRLSPVLWRGLRSFRKVSRRVKRAAAGGTNTLVHSAGRAKRVYLRLRGKLESAVHRSAPMVARRRNQYMENYYRGMLEGLRSELVSWKPDAVILPEEVVGPFWSSIVGACRRTNVPVLVTPYTIANRQEAFQSLKNVEGYQTTRNWLVARRFPKWRMKADGHDVVRLPAPHIYAHEKLRLTPSDPWMMNSGAIDRICVESSAIEAYFARSGIAKQRLSVTGSAALDEIHARKQERESVLEQLRLATGICGERPILLIGGCPNQLRGHVPHCEHASIEEIVEFVSSALSDVADCYDLLIRPHPTYPELGDLFSRRGFRSTMIPTASVIPAASLYIAFASATIRWGIACGIPTVNYDVFGYDYDEFKNVAGVFNVATKQAFQDAVRDLSPGSEKYQQAVSLLKSSSGPWSMLDGKSVDRIEAVLRSLIAARAGAKNRPIEAGAAPAAVPSKS
jgi:hypothetical protein